MATSKLMQEFDAQLKTALKSGDKDKLNTIRLLKAGLQKVLIEKQERFSPEDDMNLLRSESKKRKDAIELYRKGNRLELAEKEEYELGIISSYLPPQLGDTEIRNVIKDTLSEIGTVSIKDMGKVMGVIMPKLKGQADGKRVQEIVRQELAADQVSPST